LAEPTTNSASADAAGALFAVAAGLPLDEIALTALTDYPSTDPRAGLSLQLDLLQLWRERGQSLGGWKIGWTSRGARDRGGPGFRPFGYVLSERILASGSQLAAVTVPGAGALEPEICLTIGSRLAGPDVTIEQARAAVSGVAPAFEVIRRGLPAGLSLPIRIANGLNNWGIIVGAEVEPGPALDQLAVQFSGDGELLAEGSSGPDTLDDPFLSLTRVCAELDRVGLALEPGQRVLTGSITASKAFAAGSTYVAGFGPLGSVRVTIT
jgi:2-keto-4-pentenoate hydratase